MIDWVTCKIPYLPDQQVGDIYFKKEWSTGEILPAWNKPVSVKGSFDSGLQVQVIGREMTISGNVVKYLTGQNVVGSDDLQMLITLTYETVIDKLGLQDCLTARRAIKNGNVALTRVDCTFHYHVGTDDDVRTWLRAMESSVNVRYRGRGFFDEGMCSLMFGLRIKEGQKPRGSSLSSFKFYNKLTEMKKHKPTCNSRFTKQIHDMATGVVRAEALYRSKELLTKGAKFLRDWTSETSYQLNRDWIGKMEINSNVEMKDEIFKEMPKSLRYPYMAWLRGEDVRELCTKTTFYRHRRGLLEYDVDISVPFKGSETVKVVPVLHILEAKPVNVIEGDALFLEMLKAA